MFERASQLVNAGLISEQDAQDLLTSAGFSEWREAWGRLREMAPDDASRAALAECLPLLLVALSDAATPDGSLVNFERYVQSVPDRTALFRYLATNPRAVEILIKLFVGSQFLTEILLRNPNYLEQLTKHKRLAEFKPRAQFLGEALDAAAPFPPLAAKFDALRRFQRWELLRIGACDSFGLMDLKSVTLQLSLLADSLVQCGLALISREMRVDPAGFAVLAFGKLGGQELNYSSDIDLVFLSDDEPTRYWPLGQRLIKALTEATGEGFLYRVDMRLRPWGRSGSLVNSVDAHLGYLKQHGKLWEKQALVKARVIAGNAEIGERFLTRAEPLIYDVPVDQVRRNIREMKGRIEAGLDRQGRTWGEVKSGEGSIRDIEFVTQYLQLSNGATHPEVRSINTLDGLVRLADFGFLQADEYRQLTSGYGFLRTIEHALQLMHHKQTHSIPADEREIAWFARRLDFQNADHLLRHYRQHCEAIRAIYLKYIGGNGEGQPIANGDPTPDQSAAHLARMGPSYSETFSEEEIATHAALIGRLSDENIVEIEARPRASGKWTMTVAGYDHTGELSIMCGLLFVYGFDIAGGNVFTAEHVAPRHSAGGEKRGLARYFVNVFVVKPPLELVLPETWARYKKDLAALLRLVEEGFQREAQGMLAKRVAGALREVVEPPTSLSPVEIDIDNDASETATVLHIRSEDTIGFLYELTNALALAGIDVGRVIISSVGTRVFDTLYVTDTAGAKLTDPERQRELRAAVVLIKHFTHLLPRSPNPQAALLRFRDFLEQLFQQPNWLDDLAALERSEVLTALARLLGVSDFLWDDFLRLQYANLFPVVKDVDALARRKTRADLERELRFELTTVAGSDSGQIQNERRARLNAFKDREMFRTDMRHILGQIPRFGEFSEELADVAEVAVAAGLDLLEGDFRAR